MVKLSLIVLTVAGLLNAAHVVQLRNGVRLEVDRAEREADGVWIYSRNGILRLAADDVASIEDPAQKPAAAPQQPVYTLRSDKANPTQRMIDEAAWRHGLPPAIVHAVAQAESAYNQRAVSSAGAIGVMQLMPYTAAALGANPRDESQNIDAGTRYLREMLVKFQNHPDQVALALAAYNAGPGAVDRYRGVPPYAETQTYVRRVIGKYERMGGAETDAPKPAPPPPAAVVDFVPVPQVDKPTIAGLN